jgi:hypothetical protein
MGRELRTGRLGLGTNGTTSRTGEDGMVCDVGGGVFLWLGGMDEVMDEWDVTDWLGARRHVGTR